VESVALPVDVYTAEETRKTGSPTALEFVKTLPQVGSTVGETNQFIAGYGSIGSATLNLRGLAATRTLTVLNGRRFTENISMIPAIALERTEILKDGGAVVYGADATGGVFNFISRDSFDGALVDAEYEHIDGSNGDYNVSMLWGKEFENANLMFSAEYSYRSELDLLERDWTVRTYAENPAPWGPYHNYATYFLNVPEATAPNLSAAGLPFGTVGYRPDLTPEQCQMELHAAHLQPGR
jgi:iron complex outermembrane receptor protein